ncbi:hypothetical protein [Ornithinibacillus halotolerans]|uniref:Uncharacterized protein n=1 Tax=Ornithinibacillus halotolerans TaxID=1274357 RepID=A0A916W843_9BACI|nr:hypothetical protein [Ornithinibacillus halotolerans]GGA75994.1 hypothetical protein GCM10008025_19570 [Ornithinibacillus halotolerans]
MKYLKGKPLVKLNSTSPRKVVAKKVSGGGCLCGQINKITNQKTRYRSVARIRQR